MKVCQGCGEHQIPGKPWHDRPKCRCRKDPDFNSNGYWHDRWPNRLNLRARSEGQSSGRGPPAATHSSQSNTPALSSGSKYAGRVNNVGQPADDTVQEP
jgi:hypothetical protein